MDRAPISRREATAEELTACQRWHRWSSENMKNFEHYYDRDTQFVTLIGDATICVAGAHTVVIRPGSCVTIRGGHHGKWDIRSTVVNRYRHP